MIGTAIFSLLFLNTLCYFAFYYDYCFLLCSLALKENRVVTIQCLSGTGSLRVGAEFLAKHNQQVNIFFTIFLVFGNGHKDLVRETLSIFTKM